MKWILPLIFFLFITAGTSQAQTFEPSVIAAAGDEHPGDQLSLSWTLGELATETVQSKHGLTTEGYQQPYLRITPAYPPVIYSAKDIRSDEADIFIYPNPTTSTLTIQINTTSPHGGEARLVDAVGRLLIHTAILPDAPRVDLNLASLSPGIYMLQWRDPDMAQPSIYKIIKH